MDGTDQADTSPDADGEPVSPQDEASPFLDMMRGHVLTAVGIGAVADGADRTMALHPAPVTLDPAGHIDFGVLGVFFDMAASSAFDPPRGGVHADITITRLRPPQGRMTAMPRQARQGSRTGVVEVDLHDEAGHLVATSTQEIVFRDMIGSTSELGAEALEAMREQFRSIFDGGCRLEEPLEATLGIERRGSSWHMAMGPDRDNGGGALHGGCGIALVAAAVRDAAADRLGRASTLHAAVRYLAPARGGPFTATAEVTGTVGDIALVRVRVRDDGQDGRLVMLADAQAVRS